MNRSSKCRVYVGNLSWKVRWQDLKDHMKQVGDVVRADIIEDYEGRSKGCGLVEFSNEEGAARAIAELNDTHILDRQIFVREDREGYNPPRNSHRFNHGDQSQRLETSPGSSQNASIYRSGYGKGIGSRMNGATIIVTNLQWKTTWKNLKDLFKNCGLVIRADVLTHEDGRSKGVGKVVFATEYSARKAINMYNDYIFDGRKIGVRLEN